VTAPRRILSRAAALARNRATPFYLFDAPEAARRARAWAALASGPGPLDAFYPYKCNRLARLCEIAAAAGLGAEVTAAADLAAALGRLPGDRIVLQGASPSSESLDRALAAGVLIAVDGPQDAASLLTRARAIRRAPRYLLRLRPSAVSSEQAVFGMSPRELVSLARGLVRGGAPPPDGIAFHLGTRISAASPFLAAVREAAAAAGALRWLGAPVRVLDVGGGFPAGTDALRIAEAVRRDAFRRLPGARLLAEPGRALAADAFHLVARVTGTRGRIVRLDASRMAHAYFVPRNRHEFLPRPLREPSAPPSEIRGPLAVGLDAFTSRARIGRPRPGDLLVIVGVGAYNLIAANEWAGEKPEVVEI
jgi:diaminopimelate decarboxylase